MCSKEAEARLARVAALIDNNAIVLGAETRALVLWAGCSGRVCLHGRRRLARLHWCSGKFFLFKILGQSVNSIGFQARRFHR